MFAPKHIKKKTTSSWKLRSILLCVLLIVIFVGILTLFRSDSFQIKSVIVEGELIISEDEVLSIIERELSGKWLFVIPSKSAPLIRQNKIEFLLDTQFPEIADVKVTIHKRSELRILITEHKASNIWCLHDPRDISVVLHGCYFMDESGLVFSQSPYFSDRVFFKFFSEWDKELQNDPVGQVVMGQNVLSFVQEVVESFEKQDIIVRRMFVGKDGDFQAFIGSLGDIPTPPSAHISFSDDMSPTDISKKALLALETPAFDSDLIAKSDELNYIDLRFENKIYYKFGPDIIESEVLQDENVEGQMNINNLEKRNLQ